MALASRTYSYCFNPDVDDIECFLIQIDCMIKSLNIEDEDGKKRALIESLSTKALKQLLVHLQPVKWDAESTTLEILKEGLRKLYTPQVNKWVARGLFNHRVQREDENVEDYAGALKDMASYCDFGDDYESRIMEKLSVGLKDATNKQAMFRFYGESVPNIDVTLEKAIEKAISIESASNLTYMFNPQGYDSYDTGAMGIQSWSVTPKVPNNWRCWRCGECDHGAESCWVRTQVCPICREYGHIPQMCSVVQRSAGDGQPMDNIIDLIRSQSGGPQHFSRRGGRGPPIPSLEPVDEAILEFLRSPMQNQRQFQGRGRIPSLPHNQNANDMGYDNMRGSVGRGSVPQPAFGVGKQRQFPQNTPAFDESDIEYDRYDRNSLSPNRRGRAFRGRGSSRISPARVEEVQTEYLQSAHPAGRNGRHQVNNQLSAGGGGGPARASVAPAQNTSMDSGGGGPARASVAPTQNTSMDSAPTAVESASQNATSVNQGSSQDTNISQSLSQALNKGPPQLSEKSSKQFMPQESNVHHTLPKQNKQMNNLLSEMQHRHKNWRGSKSQSPGDFDYEGNEKDKFRSLPGRGQRHSWGGSGLNQTGSMTSEGDTDESIDQMYASRNNLDGRTNIVALDLHSPAAAAVPTDKALSVSSTPLVKPFKLPPSAFAPFEPVTPAPPTPPPRVRGNKLTSDTKGLKESVVKSCSKEESEFVEYNKKSKEDSESVEHSKHSKEDSESIDHKKHSKEDFESVNIESQSEDKSESVEKKEDKMTAVTNSEEKNPSPKTRPNQPPLPARAPRITVPHMKSPEPNPEVPPSSPSTPPPPPPPPPSDYDCIASPTPPDLPPPPEICRSTSPPPPPPPPSYHLTEVPGDELPPPPPPTHQQEATLEFPPPPPAIVESKKDHTDASSAYLQTPPTPPPRHVRNGTKTERMDTVTKETHEESIDKPDLPPPPIRVLRGIDAFFPDDAICNQVIEETEEEDEEFHTDITDTDDEVFHEALSELPEKYINSNQKNLETSDLCSLDSSSTLTATLLLTQASDVSPLPPHALRVSPVPTEEATITPVSDFTPVSNIFDMSKDSTLDMETPAPTPQLSETPVTTGEYSPDLQKISSPSIEEFNSRVGSAISFSQSPTGTLSSENLSTLTPEISDVDRRSPSLSSANATRAHMSSPRSIDTPTLFSLPTDPSRISVDFDSLVAETLTIDTSTFNTSSQNHFLASCSEFSDSTSRRSIDSALGSAPLSPAYTGSCTITPMPTDSISQMSTNPTTTPIPSPIPTELRSPTPPSSFPSEAFVSPWQSFSNSASIDTSSIQEDITPTDLNLETSNVQNLMQTSLKDEKDSNLSSITDSSVKKTDEKSAKSSDDKSFSSFTNEELKIDPCSEDDKKIENKYNLNVEENEKSNITTSLESSSVSTATSFNAECANGETEQIEKILKDVIDTGSQLITSLSETQKKVKDSVTNQLNKQEDNKTSCANISDNQTPSSVTSPPPPPPPPPPAPPSVTSSIKSKARSSLTSTSSVESTSSLTSMSSLSNETNTVSSVDSVKLPKKGKNKADVIVKELGARNSLTDQIVRELGERQKLENRSNSQDKLKKIDKPSQPDPISTTPFTVSTPPGSPATLRRRGRPTFLPRGSPEPHLEILSIPDPPTPPPRRNKFGSTKANSEASKCDLSIASTTKAGGFIPRPPQRANTLPVITLRHSMPGKLPSSPSMSPLPATVPVPITGNHNKSPSSPIPIPGKRDKSSPSSSPSLRSLINMGGAKVKSLSPLRDRDTKHKSPARSSSPIRWVNSPIPSSPQSPITAAQKSPEQAINFLDNIMDSLDALTANLPSSPTPEPEKSGQVFFPQGSIPSNKIKQDTSDDVEIPWRKKRPEAGSDTKTDESDKTSASKKGRPNSECLENLVNQILSDVDTNLEMQKTEVSSYHEQTESKQTESFKTKSLTKQVSSEARSESFIKEYEQKVNIIYSNKNDISFAAQSQQEKLDKIRQKKNPEYKEESKSAENSCDSTHKETTVTFASNSQESRIHDDATSTSPPVSRRSKTPPLPPPRSTTTTPKPLIGLSHGPIPPVRQYMLVPINHPLAVHSARSTPARQLSPPPAPLRSSSIRKTSPPPPPPPSRSRSHTPVGRIEWTEHRPPLPPPPLSACTSTTPTPLKLTPVPEESSSRSPSVHSQSSQSTDEQIGGNTVFDQTSKDSTNKSSVSCDFVGKVSDNISSAEPPRVPPPPSDDVDNELPPPPPPPPSDITPEEETPPPPPLPIDISSLSIQRVPTPPPRANIVTPVVPPPPNIPLNSSPLSPQLPPPELPPPPVVDVESPNNINNFLSAESEPGNSEASIMPSELPPPQTLQANETANTSIKVVPEINEAVLQCWKCGVLNPTHNTSNCPGPRMCTNKSFLPPGHEPPPDPVPPPPPPPPPKPKTGSDTESSSPTPSVLSISPYGRIVVDRADLPPPAPEEEIRKVFQNAKNWAWLDPFSDTLAVYTQLRPTMQQGPQCGIVALSMATQIFAETMDVDAILKMAKDYGFTAHGEMFSAEKMAELANEISGVEAYVRRDVLSSPKILLETLLQGDFLLVPYDADSNHQPSMKKGHRAHWGIVCGALVQCPSLNVSMGGAAKQDPQVDHLYHLRPKNRSGLPSSVRRGGGGTTPVSGASPRFSASPLDAWGTPDLELWSVCSSRVSTPQMQSLDSLPDNDMTMVVLWRQGKSRNLIASTLESLYGSNDQLEEYHPSADEREQEYVIESVKDGLSQQVVVLHKTKYALSDLLGVLQEKD